MNKKRLTPGQATGIAAALLDPAREVRERQREKREARLEERRKALPRRRWTGGGVLLGILIGTLAVHLDPVPWHYGFYGGALLGGLSGWAIFRLRQRGAQG